MKLTEDIHRIDGMGMVNAYAIIGGGAVTLVDTGFRGKAEVILGYLRDLGFEPPDVHTIVLTHGDTDHIGNVAELKAATGARVAIHEADAPTLTGADYARAKGFMGATFGLLRKVVKAKPLQPDILLHDGDTVSGFTVHHFAGHTVGSIWLSREDGVVFSGDTLLGDSKGNAAPPTKAIAYDYAEALAAAEAIEATHYTLLLPGHGEPVRVDR
jgi:glyoxylase-like metal-dependent hydrolase (beta-lactamase superfamily II)